MTYTSRQSRSAVIGAYGDMVEDQMVLGWQPSLVTFMFRPLPGSKNTIINMMQHGIDKFYSTLVTRVVRNPRSPHQQHLLPKLIGAPDEPVFKHAKQSIKTVSINDGLHFHGIILLPGKSRLGEGLQDHVRSNREMYLAICDRLSHIDVKPITATPRKAVGYALKAVENGVCSLDDIVVLPKVLRELSPKEAREPVPKVPKIRWSVVLNAGPKGIEDSNWD
jgi:hypothetical protein